MVKLDKDEIIYLDAVLATMMASMEAYNLNSSDEFFYEAGSRMKNKFISEMKNYDINESTIGAILAECGECYGYKDDGNEENEELIEFFMPDKIKERLESRR